MKRVEARAIAAAWKCLDTKPVLSLSKERQEKQNNGKNI